MKLWVLWLAILTPLAFVQAKSVLAWKRTNLELVDQLRQVVGHGRGTLLKLTPTRADEVSVSAHSDRYFHQYYVRTSTALAQPQLDPLLQALITSLRRSNGHNSASFGPGYGLKIQGPGGPMEMLVSFQDDQLLVFGRGKPLWGLLLGGEETFAEAGTSP